MAGTWTEEQQQTLRDMMDKRCGYEEIAEAIGKPRYCINQYCTYHKIKRKPMWTKEVKAEAIKLHTSGVELTEIAKKLNLPRPYVYKKLKALGFAFKHRSYVWDEKLSDELYRAVFCCSNITEVAEKIGKSYDAVRNRLYFLYGTKSIPTLRKLIVEEREGA